MDYSPLLSQIEHPLLLDLDLDEVDNIGHDFQKIKLDDGEDLSFNLESILSPNSTTTVKSGFFRRSKSKTEELGSPSKISSPIEIKGSPGHHKSISTTNNINNKEKEHQQGSHSSSGSGSRMSFFKVLTRRNSSANQGKHKSKLSLFLLLNDPYAMLVAYYSGTGMHGTSHDNFFMDSLKLTHFHDFIELN